MSSPLVSLPLAVGARVITDLHLDLESAESVEPFLEFLDGLEQRCPQLWVLGDLFDVWVGPAAQGVGAAPGVLAALRRLSERGTQILIVPGNRDFLLDASFEAASGARLLPEGSLALDPQGQSIVLVHGDRLCTLDRGYQRLRAVLRSPLVRGLARVLPYVLARRVGKRLRRASQAALAQKPVEEKSIQRSAVEHTLAEHRAQVLICGHAHQFVDQSTAAGRWIVLEAFGGARDVLCIDARGLEFRSSAAFRKLAAPAL